MDNYTIIKDKSLPIHGIENDTLISKEKGCLSYGFLVSYPPLYSKDIADYTAMRNTMNNIFAVLENDYIVHKQEFFIGTNYTTEPQENESDLERYNRIHFQGREVRNQYSYIYITKVPENYVDVDSKNTNSFLLKERRKFISLTIDDKYISPEALNSFFVKKERIKNLLDNSLFNAKELKQEDYLDENKGVLNLFKNYDFSGLNRDKIFKNNKCFIGRKELRFYTLENTKDLPDFLNEITQAKEKQSDDTLRLYKSNISELGLELDKDHVLNQYFYIPSQEAVFKKLKAKENRLYNFTHWMNPNGSNERVEQKGESIDSENNKIFARQVKEFKNDIVTKSQKVIFAHVNVGILDGDIDTSENFPFKLKENVADIKDLYFATCPGNAIGIPTSLYMHLTEDAAIGLAYFEDYSKGNATFGMRYVDTLTGKPVYFDVFHTPKKKKITTNLNAWGVGKSGTGKSFNFSKMLSHEYELGNHVFNIDGSSSNERSTKYFDGFFFNVSKGEKIGLNPFLIPNKSEEAIIEKRSFIANFLLNLIDDPEKKYANNLTFELFTNLSKGYYEDVNSNYCFNSFYDYFRECAPKIIKENGLEKDIKLSAIQFLLKSYYKGGVYDYLLNSRDEKLNDLLHNRFVTFQIKKIKDDPKLFSNITFLLTNLYKEKLYNPDLLHLVKFLHYDESWTGMDKPIIMNFMKDTIKTVRSQNGATIFTSQDIEDFFNSFIINVVTNNSDLGVVSDLSGYKGKKEYVKGILGLSDYQMNRLFALGNNVTDKYNMKEFGLIYAKKHLITLGNEVSLEEKSIFETDPIEKVKLAQMDKQNNGNMGITAIQYSGN